ncbi:MAG: PrsW family intramembrane metalloprotease [Lachnospiraceae bacterium]|jgi:RsiW-degrading membrane proteinase PrsW (M82 family)|nr:PrsW family intramembrane metalloprotease [Lachnospiraceae bacterium]
MEMILVAGLLPCVVLLFYIYRKDTVEKEPVGLLIKLLLLGCLSTIPAIILEMIGSYILSAIGLTEGSTLYYLIENFLIIAVAEEASKRYMLRKGSWNDPAFNYVFDGVVYAVFVSLGFAGLENVGYIAGFGMEVAVIRGLAAIPLHAICGVFMGHFYGLHKAYSKYGYAKEAAANKKLSLLVPVLIHGFYDFCASVQSETMSYVWLGFVIVMDVIAFIQIRNYSKNDKMF